MARKKPSTKTPAKAPTSAPAPADTVVEEPKTALDTVVAEPHPEPEPEPEGKESEAPESSEEPAAKLPPVAKPVKGLGDGIWVKNIVRRRDARLHRMVSPVRHRFKQYIAGRRLLRGQSTFLPQQLAIKAGPQLLHMIDLGVVIAAGKDKVTVLPYEAVEELLRKWGGSDEEVKPSPPLPIKTEKIGHHPGEQAPKAKPRKVPKRPKKDTPPADETAVAKDEE